MHTFCTKTSSDHFGDLDVDKGIILKLKVETAFHWLRKGSWVNEVMVP